MRNSTARRIFSAVFGALLLLGACGQAVHAGFVSSSAAFAAANPGLPTLTFEDIAPPASYVEPAPSFAADGVLFTTPTYGSDVIAISDSAFFLLPTDALFVNRFGEPLIMNFLLPTDAVGFDIAIGFGGHDATVDVYNGATLLGSTTFDTENEGVFTTFIGAYGFGPITQVVVTPTVDGFVLIDNLSFGSVVPEPSSILLSGFAAVGVLAFARRSRRSA